jgi:hypothetical protein
MLALERAEVLSRYRAQPPDPNDLEADRRELTTLILGGHYKHALWIALSIVKSEARSDPKNWLVSLVSGNAPTDDEHRRAVDCVFTLLEFAAAMRHQNDFTWDTNVADKDDKSWEKFRVNHDPETARIFQLPTESEQTVLDYFRSWLARVLMYIPTQKRSEYQDIVEFVIKKRQQERKFKINDLNKEVVIYGLAITTVPNITIVFVPISGDTEWLEFSKDLLDKQKKPLGVRRNRLISLPDWWYTEAYVLPALAKLSHDPISKARKRKPR